MKTWFITGSSSGFGRLMTERLLARGDRVAATLRNVGALDALREGNDGKLWVAKLDVTDPDAVRRVVGAAFADLGTIDVIVNNAGYGLCGAAEELSDEDIHEQVQTNLIGSIQVIRAALPHLRAQGGGHVLQVSSEGGQITYPNFSLYHATKWGIEGFIEAVAQEVAGFNIRFTIAEPGPAKTSFAGGIISAPAMDAYRDTPAGQVRRLLETGTFKAKGDPLKMVLAMIDCVDRGGAKRLALGSGSHDAIRSALLQRLEVLEAHKPITLSTDFDA